MIQQEGSFADAKAAHIFYQMWLPDGEPKATLVLVHGLAEHCGRYMNVVNHFVPLGYAVYGLDHIGHGKSDGTRAYVDRFFDFVDTLKQFVDLVKQWQPAKPCFMIGHSMGGLISAAYLLEHQADLNGAVLSAPAIKASGAISSTTLTVGRLLSSLAPKMGVAQLAADGISQDPAVVEAYVNDPLVCSGKITARLGAEMLKTMPDRPGKCRQDHLADTDCSGHCGSVGRSRRRTDALQCTLFAGQDARILRGLLP